MSNSEPPPMTQVFTEDFSYVEPPKYGVRFEGRCGLSPYYTSIKSKTDSLRDVKFYEYVMDEDINDFIELLRSFDELNKAIINCVESQGLEVPTSLKQQINYFSLQVSLLQMVKSGMIVKAHLWNDVVNLMKYEESILDTLKDKLYPTLLVPKPVYQEEFTYITTPPTDLYLQFMDDYAYKTEPPDLYLQFMDDFNW